MKRMATLAITALLMAGCTPAAALTTPEEIEKLSDREALALLECQERKVARDLNEQEAREYAREIADELLGKTGDLTENPQKGDATVQSMLAEDGYTCTMAEVKEVIKQAEQAEQERIFGPSRELADVSLGLFGGAFAGDVEYQIDKQSTGEWMMTAKVRELEVSTTADSEAELHELAGILKEKKSDGVDLVRAEYYSGKEDLGQQTYDANGTICIILSEDSVTFFADQYPNGGAWKDARRDFREDDGIVFLGSME